MPQVATASRLRPLILWPLQQVSSPCRLVFFPCPDQSQPLPLHLLIPLLLIYTPPTTDSHSAPRTCHTKTTTTRSRRPHPLQWLSAPPSLRPSLSIYILTSPHPRVAVILHDPLLRSWALTPIFHHFISHFRSLVPYSFPHAPLGPSPNHLTSHLIDHMTNPQSTITCHHSAVRSIMTCHHLTLYGLPAHDAPLRSCQLMMELYLELPRHGEPY